MATHSSILAWKIPWLVEPGRLQSVGSQRVGLEWMASLSFFSHGWSSRLSWSSLHYGWTREGNGTPLQYSCLEIPWTEEPGGLQSRGLRRVGHNWATSLSLFAFMHWRRKWQPTPLFLPGEPQGRESLVGCRLWGHIVGHDWSDLAAAAGFIRMPWKEAGVEAAGAPLVALVVKTHLPTQETQEGTVWPLG